MNKKILTLALVTPLLYTACSSSTNKPTKTVEEAGKVVEVVETPKSQITHQEVQKGTATVSYANDKKRIKNQGMMHIKSFMEILKPTLVGLIKSDKTLKVAMSGCTSMAQSMTNDYNAISPDTKVRRTALKYRNEINKPDVTDTLVMERFLASNDFTKPLVVDMPTHYRVYKALTIKQPCLACHGENISKDLHQMLVKNYPTDMATNFKLGEFRGVVVAEVKK